MLIESLQNPIERQCTLYDLSEIKLCMVLYTEHRNSSVALIG